MRQLPGAVNRGWLTVVGVILLLTGLLGVLVSTGRYTALATSAGLPAGPQLGRPVVPAGAATVLDRPLIVVAIGAIGVIVGLLGLTWLLAQIPHPNRARPLRLHDDATSGLTICDPQILSDAVEDDLNAMVGASSADAVLRGTAKSPELTVRIRVDDRTEVCELIRGIQTDVADRLAAAMDTPLARLAVQIDIEKGKRTTDSVTL